MREGRRTTSPRGAETGGARTSRSGGRLLWCSLRTTPFMIRN